MAGIFDELGGITGGVAAEGLAFAAGFAAGRALEPAAVTISQDAWNAAPVRRLDPDHAAEAAAENYATYDVMAAEASYSGYDASRFAYIYDVTLTAPGVGELLQMLRRQTISSGNFTHGLRKAKLEPMWDDAIAELANQFISATDLAYMIVRGVLPDEGTLPGSLPTQADNLNLPPQIGLNPVTEAAKSGWDQERLAAMVARSGLAMAPTMAAQANFRGILTDNDYLLTIARGDLFPAYANPVKEASRQILTAEQAAELQLRGYLTAAQRRNLTQLHGMTDANSDLLYDVLGRGLNLHSAFIAERRGGVFQGDTSQIPDWALWMLQRGNLRPETYNLAWAARETYPSYFVTRALLQAGTITAERGTELFMGLGWPADVATAAGQTYGTTGGAVADPHVSKAATQLWGTTHTAYKATEIGKTAAQANLSVLGIPAAAQTEIFNYWDAERATIRHQISVAQLLKAEKDGITNPATGQAYTNADVVAALVDRGYSQADATVLASE